MWKINFKLIFIPIVFDIILLNWTTGWKNETLKNTRIINGADASLNQSRHQVSIRIRAYEYQFGHGHTCGGSLISKNVVLSAAHCFVNDYFNILVPEENFIVVMGTLDRLNYTNTTLIFNIMKIIIHKNFAFATLNNDIALLILDGEIPSKHPTVAKILLNAGPIKNNTVCQVTGWGYSDTPTLARQLQVADQPIIDKDECCQKNPYGFLILDGMMCAGYLEDETKINNGDSGGPLVCAGIQVGIVSCRSWDNIGPGIYTDIAYYKKWILEELTNYNCDLPKFDYVFI